MNRETAVDTGHKLPPELCPVLPEFEWEDPLNEKELGAMNKGIQEKLKEANERETLASA